MTPLDVGIVGTLCMVALLFSGIPVALAMGVTGFVGFMLVSGFTPALGLLKTVPYTNEKGQVEQPAPGRPEGLQ